MATFPVFASHAEARCCVCDGPLTQHHDAGYAPGRGQFRGLCDRGAMEHHSWTYYDLDRGYASNRARTDSEGAYRACRYFSERD